MPGTQVRAGSHALWPQIDSVHNAGDVWKYAPQLMAASFLSWKQMPSACTTTRWTSGTLLLCMLLQCTASTATSGQHGCPWGC